MDVNILKPLLTEIEENNCISIYKLGDNNTFTNSKQEFSGGSLLISPNVSTVMGMRSQLAASFPCAIYA